MGGEQSSTMRLPSREAFLATFILRTLREWHRTYIAKCNGCGNSVPVQIMDIDQLETRCAELLKTWNATREMMERSGFDVTEEQPGMKGAR